LWVIEIIEIYIYLKGKIVEMRIAGMMEGIRIVNVGYRSVNCYIILTEQAKLLVDVGWPRGMQELKATLAREGFSVKDVTHALITHYHMDHGAIAQEVKDKGAILIVMESQREYLNAQSKFIKPADIFHKVMDEGNIYLRFDESRVYLKKIGIPGEIIPTASHSPDHITLVLDGGVAFTGDLPPETGCPEGSDAQRDWKKLRSMDVRRVYPAHGAFDLEIG
jgi:ribonuclease/clavin/mitogillin